MARLKRAHSTLSNFSDEEEIKYGRQLCSTSFFDCKHLYQYMKVHKTDREFLCSVCQRRFTHAGNVQQHMLVHLKAYQCIICNGGFADLSAFQRHLEAHIDRGIDVDIQAATEIALNIARDRMEQAKSNLRFECRIYQDRSSDNNHDDSPEYKEQILTMCNNNHYDDAKMAAEQKHHKPNSSGASQRKQSLPITTKCYNSTKSSYEVSSKVLKTYSFGNTSIAFEDFVEKFFTIIAND